jgi:protein-S-isoprenylcysteine O-methyltransferase Ste14
MGTFYIVIASILWGVVHSILASYGFKHIVRNMFGATAFYRLYRLSYNLFALASFLPIALMLITFPDRLLYSITGPWVYVMTIAQGLAAFALIAGVMQTGLWEFSGLAQLAPSYGDSKPSGLVVDGLYAYVRHPLYSAGLLFIWLSPEMSVNRLALWVIFSLYIVVGAYFEERKLLKDFGSDYAEYKAKTPMFIPRWPKPI